MKTSSMLNAGPIYYNIPSVQFRIRLSYSVLVRVIFFVLFRIIVRVHLNFEFAFNVELLLLLRGLIEYSNYLFIMICTYLDNYYNWVDLRRFSDRKKGADIVEMVKSSSPEMKETKAPCNVCQKIPCICLLYRMGHNLMGPMVFNPSVQPCISPIYMQDRNFYTQNMVYPADANFLSYPGVNMMIPAAIPHVSPSSSSSPPSPSSPPSSQNSPTPSRPRRPSKKFKCDSCDKSFDYKHVLQNHQRTHTGEKPFGCNVCGNRFTRDHHLKTHMRLHTGEKPYSCEHCSMRFVQVANLRRHQRIHGPIKCNTCDEEFPDSAQLQNHLRQHNLNPAEECNICNVNHQPGKKCPLRINKLQISGTNDIDDDSDVVSSGDSQTSGGSDQHVSYEDTEAEVPRALDLSTVRIGVSGPIQSEPEDLSMKKFFR